MSIAVLTQVYDEVRRLAIAGSSLAPGDFRLKKLIPPLETAGQKAPVFGKVAELSRKVVEASEKESADALLNLSTLVSSILYTQGESGISGTMKPLETVDLGPPVTGTSARVLKPLIEALTTTGSGRLEIIRDAHQRGAFRDMRLVNPVLQAIDDPYGEIGDLIADDVLPVYGRTIYPEVKKGFDVKGRGGHVRRLRLMHRLDPEATKPLVEEALESGSKEMKIAALGCIGDSKDGLVHLLDQVSARTKDIRTAALNGLAKFKTKDAVAALLSALSGKDADIAIVPAAKNASPQILKYLLEECQTLLDEVVTAKAKAKRASALTRLQVLLQGFSERTDKKTVDFLKSIFDRREELCDVKGSVSSPDGSDIVWYATQLLVSTGAKPVLKMLGESHAGLPSQVLHCCFVGAVQTMTPKNVYDEYSSYLLAKASRKKADNDVRDRKEAIIESVASIAIGRQYDFSDYHYAYRTRFYGMSVMEPGTNVKLDPRWLDAAIEADELDLVTTLRRPKHKKLNSYLSSQLASKLKKRDAYWEVRTVMESMIAVEHPDVVESFLTSLSKCLGAKGHTYYYTYWLGRLIPELPKAALKPLEELIPTLPDKAADELVPQIAELQTRHGAGSSKKSKNG